MVGFNVIYVLSDMAYHPVCEELLGASHSGNTGKSYHQCRPMLKYDTPPVVSSHWGPFLLDAILIVGLCIRRKLISWNISEISIDHWEFLVTIKIMNNVKRDYF